MCRQARAHAPPRPTPHHPGPPAPLASRGHGLWRPPPSPAAAACPPKPRPRPHLDASQVHRVVAAPKGAVVTPRQPRHLVAVPPQRAAGGGVAGHAPVVGGRVVPIQQALGAAKHGGHEGQLPGEVVGVLVGEGASQTWLRAAAAARSGGGRRQAGRPRRRPRDRARPLAAHPPDKRAARLVGRLLALRPQQHQAGAEGGRAEGGGHLGLQQRAGEEAAADLGAAAVPGRCAAGGVGSRPGF